MLTRCPHCATAFRVSAQQLKSKHGAVRCGQCRQIFNALDRLVEEAPVAAAPMESLDREPVATIAEEREEGIGIVPPPEEEAAAVADDRLIVEEEPVEEEIEARPSYLDEVLPEGPALSPPSARWVAWLWGSGVFVAFVILAVQLVLHFRTELAVAIPGARGALRDVAGLFGLDLPLPHKPELLSIESSDMHPAAEGQLVLTATLKNRADFPQAYPDVELTLTDSNDRALLRRVLAPQDYLPAGSNIAAGFPANGEMAITLNLEAAVAGASGYKIYLFYP